MKLIQVKHITGHMVWLNPDRIVKVIRRLEGSKIWHDPYMSGFDELDWTDCEENPHQVATLIETAAIVEHISARL